MARKEPEPPQVVPKEFKSADEIERAIAKLERRIKELETFDSAAPVLHKTGGDEIVASNVRETIRELFGTNSPEFQEHQCLQLWSGPMFMNMPRDDVVQGIDRGRRKTIAILRSLTDRLKEKLEEFGTNTAAPATYLKPCSPPPKRWSIWSRSGPVATISMVLP